MLVSGFSLNKAAYCFCVSTRIARVGDCMAVCNNFVFWKPVAWNPLQNLRVSIAPNRRSEKSSKNLKQVILLSVSSADSTRLANKRFTTGAIVTDTKPRLPPGLYKWSWILRRAPEYLLNWSWMVNYCVSFKPFLLSFLKPCCNAAGAWPEPGAGLCGP